MYNHFNHLLNFLGFKLVKSWHGVTSRFFEVRGIDDSTILIQYHPYYNEISAYLRKDYDEETIFSGCQLEIFVQFFAELAGHGKEDILKFMYGAPV